MVARRLIGILFVSWLCLAVKSEAIDTSSFDADTKNLVERAENAARMGPKDAYHQAFQEVVNRIGLIPQLAELDRLYLVRIAQYQEALEEYSAYLDRWKDIENPAIAIDTVLSHAARLVLLTESGTVSLLQVGRIWNATDRLLDVTDRTPQELQSIRAETLTASGRASYAWREYTRARRCFESAGRLIGGDGLSPEQAKLKILLGFAVRRGSPATYIDSAPLYSQILPLDLVVRDRLLVLYDIVSGDWKEDEQRQFQQEILERFPNSPEAILIQNP